MSRINSTVLKRIAELEEATQIDISGYSVARRNRYYWQKECDALNQRLKAADQIDGFIRNIVVDLRPRDKDGHVISAKIRK